MKKESEHGLCLYREQRGKLNAVKLSLCVEFEEGLDHKSLLYAALSCISNRGCFQNLNS